MLMLISPAQGPKVLTNKHKPLASLSGTGGCYEYFCPPSHPSVDWKERSAIVLLFYYTYLLTQRRLKPPGGVGVGAAGDCKKTASCSFTRSKNVFVPTWRECRWMGGCTLLQDPYLISQRHDLCRPPYGCVFTVFFYSMLHSNASFFIPPSFTTSSWDDQLNVQGFSVTVQSFALF